MKSSMIESGAVSTWMSTLILALNIALGGCASMPPPKSEVAVSKAAINSALSADAAEYAPVPLKTAQDKVDKADKIVVSGDSDKYAEAKQLAEQAVADAKVAEVTAEAAKAKKSLDESQRDQHAIQQEIDRQK